MSLNPASNGAIILQKTGKHTRGGMLYYSRTMKRLLRPAILLSISLLIALFSMAVTYTAKYPDSALSTTAAYFLQATPTPPGEVDRTEVGSTDGIVVMGGVIVLIVLVPILIRRKSWLPSD